MTDIITTTPIAVRSIALSQLTPFSRRLGSAMGAGFAAMGQAFAMACAAPYVPRRHETTDADLQGRDPRW